MAEALFKPGEQIGTLEDGTVVRQARPEQRRRLKTMGAGFIQRLEFDPLVAPVDNLITEGVVLLCGASKIGKSWLMLDLCCAVSSGRHFLGRETQQGSVLYLALEDSPRRIKSRLDALGEMPSDDFVIATEASLLDAGLLDELQEWISVAHNPRLIVIDTLQKIRGISARGVNIYQQDYDAICRLKRFADQHHVAIVLVHHLSKAKDALDPFDRISGSTGLMGAGDTTILIDRQRGSNDAKLTYTGRDIVGDDITLRMQNGRWTAIGQDVVEREVYEQSPVVQTIRSLMAESFGNELSITTEALREAIAARTGQSPFATKTALKQAISRLAPDLQRFDRITVSDAPRVGTQRGLRFTKSQEVRKLE